MSENVNVSSESKGERFNKFLAVLIAVVTTIIALITYVQSDAGNRDDQANRDSKRYSLEAMEQKVSGDARVNYDYNKAYQAYYEYELLAASAREAGDEEGAANYEILRDKMAQLSPMLQPPYYDPASGKDPDVARYEADVYLVKTTSLMEKFSAASKVKDAWDYKANTYIIHLTLLAVALFLFGMATTISGSFTRWIFTAAGLGVTLVSVIWALVLYLQPVPDLRDCKTADGTYAIDAYAQGVGLAYQEKYQDAIASFDKAVACDSGYVNALVERAQAYNELGDLKAAISDFEKARAAGDARSNTAGNLAWAYYLEGRLNDAVAMNKEALKAAPDEYWIQFDLALSLLANGQIDEAKAEYQKGMDLAAGAVASAKAANAEPPSYLWYGLEDAAQSLDSLLATIEAGGEDALFKALVNPEATVPEAETLITRLKSQAVALEYTGLPPAGELTATISPFTFAEMVKSDTGEVTDYTEKDSFPAGTYEVAVLFDYEGMQDGQEVIFKIYVDGEEDPSWRLVMPWELGASGSAERQLSLAYSNTQVLKSGEYTVEMYVNNHLAQRGFFMIE